MPSKTRYGSHRWADFANAEVLGDEALIELFQKMPYRSQANVILSAYRRSSKVMTDRMRSNLRAVIKHPETGTGNLYDSIGTYGDRRNHSEPVLFIGARKFGRHKGYHAHLVEVGTEPRETSAGAGRGRMKPTFFFARAANATKDQVVASYQDDQLRAFHDYVIRYNKKAKR